jgi:Mn2+/Fe2+ NRAMP family transporter
LTAKYRELIQSLGPGLLYAGAAIGVSHLVQSTRAGAEFGSILIIAVVLAHIFKYPFFEFGPRFASVTGKSLLHGYRWQGEWALMLFLFLTLSTMFIVQAAVTVVTAGIAQHISGLDIEAWQWSGILLTICAFILLLGRYSVLDRFMKVIIITLAITTVFALGSALMGDFYHADELKKIFSFRTNEHLFFLIALVGWMPAPIDIAIWHSVWTVARNRSGQKKHQKKEALFDFKVGYWGTAGLAICFLLLGSVMLFGSGQELPKSGAAFAGLLIDMYTKALGPWSYYLIVIAAFTTMFSTTLTLLDAFPRVLRPSIKLLLHEKRKTNNQSMYNWALLVLIAGTMLILVFFANNMRGLVDLATTISFLTAPVLAWLNYRSVTHTNFPEEHRPSRNLRVLSGLGIFFLGAFSLYFLYVRFL